MISQLRICECSVVREAMRLAVAQRRETLRCFAATRNRGLQCHRSRVASRSRPYLEFAPLFLFAYDSTGVDMFRQVSSWVWLRAGWFRGRFRDCLRAPTCGDAEYYYPHAVDPLETRRVSTNRQMQPAVVPALATNGDAAGSLQQQTQDTSSLVCTGVDGE